MHGEIGPAKVRLVNPSRATALLAGLRHVRADDKRSRVPRPANTVISPAASCSLVARWHTVVFISDFHVANWQHELRPYWG